MWWHNKLWLNAELYGEASPDLKGDYKGNAWNDLPAGQFLLLVHAQGDILGWKSFNSRNPLLSMFDWMNSGNNIQITNGILNKNISEKLWGGEHLVRASNELWVNQNDNFDGQHCNTNDWDRLCSDTCKVGGNDGGGLGNCHDCTHDPYWRTTSEAQAGWYNWTNNNQPCYANCPHNKLGMFGSDTAYPATGQNRDVANQASWSYPNGYDYDYALFIR